MLEIPEEIKQLFRSDNISNLTKKKFKLTFYDEKIEVLYPYETLFPDESLFPSEHGHPWLVIENDRIDSESLIITESLSESEDLEFGSCESTSMEIIVADVIDDLTEKEFELTVEIGNYEMPLGIFTVKSFVRQADRRKRKITAYDRMRWFDTDVSNWFNELVFPMPLRTFRYALCDYIGVTQEDTELIFDSLLIQKTIDPQEISGIDILKSICQINGRFGHIDKTGRLKYIKLQQTGLYPSEELFPDELLFPSETGMNGSSLEIVNTFKDLTYEDYVVEGIDGLSIRQQEGDIGANVGIGENPYAIEGNFIVYGKNPSDLLDIAEALLPEIEGRTYKPSNLECSAMPWVEVGDAIRAITKDDMVETFVMKRVTKGCQAMMETITSTGSQKREEIFGINKQIIQLEGKSAVIIKSVEEVSVRVTDLKKQEEAHFKITSEAIDAEVTRATEEEGKLSGRITVNANNINIEVTRAKGEEERLFGRITVESNRITAEVTRATEEEGKLSGRITVEAGRITTEVSERKNGEKEIRSSITQTANEIKAEVSSNYVANGTVSVKLSGETGNVEIKGNRLIVDSTNFKVNKGGDVTMSGKITSVNGNIGGWDIGNGYMRSRDSNSRYVGVGVDGTAYAFYAGGTASNGSNGAFRVSHDGSMVSTKADISGKVTATSGEIAQWTIGDGCMYSNANGKYVGLGVYNKAWAFYAGGTQFGGGDGVFRVGHEGELFASNANISGTITAGAGILAPRYDASGNLIGGWRVDSYGLTGIGDATELKGGNVNTPSLMVERGSSTIFSAVTDHAGEGEIILRADITMEDNKRIYNLRVDTAEWSTSPYNDDVATILDHIWTGHGNGWGLEELDERVTALENGSGCRGYCDDSSCDDTACPVADDDNCPKYGGGCTSDCNWEGCTEYGPGYP